MDAEELSDLARAHLPDDLEIELGDRLVGLVQAAQREWPEIELDPGRFVAFLAARIDGPGDLERLRVADLYLACAAIDRAPGGIESFEKELVAATEKGLRRIDRSQTFVDEVRQVMRERMLVGQHDALPKLLDYRGEGSLRGWIAISATRYAYRITNRRNKELPLEAWDMSRSVSGGDLDHIREMYQREFKQAFEVAFSSLESDDRNYLRLSILDRIRIDDLAQMLGVHRATAARRLATARARLAKATRRELARTLQIDRKQLNSLLALVRSQLDLSMERILDTSKPE